MDEVGLSVLWPKPDSRINKNWTAKYYDPTAKKIEKQMAEFI